MKAKLSLSWLNILPFHAISNLYQPPQEGRLPAACHIFEILQLLPPGTPWICVGDFVIALMKMFCFSKMKQSDCSVVLSKAHKATLFRPDGRATDAATTQSQTPCTMYSTCAMTLKPFQTIKFFAVVFSCRASLGWLRCFVSRDMATCPSPSPVHLKIVNRPVASCCLQTQHRRS